MTDETKKSHPDYLAELYVAGVLADSGWNVYFPHRDEGFDFILSKQISSKIFLRPVQVKGKYPTIGKLNKTTYGYVGRLTALHPEMVLAIPYFSADRSIKVPTCIAYMPSGMVRRHKRGYRCEPATFKNGIVQPRREYSSFFDVEGLHLLELEDWSERKVVLK